MSCRGAGSGCAVSCLALVVVSCFSAGFGGGELCRVGMACCLSPDVFGGEPCRADVACWGGWGPHTPCARQIGPHPPQPTPPSRHGSLRCVWVRRQKCVTPHSGAGAHGIARARGEPFRQSLLAVCGGRLTPCPGAERSSASPNQQTTNQPTLLAACGGRLTPCPGAERSSASPNQQSEAAPPNPDRPAD